MKKQMIICISLILCTFVFKTYGSDISSQITKIENSITSEPIAGATLAILPPGIISPTGRGLVDYDPSEPRQSIESIDLETAKQEIVESLITMDETYGMGLSFIFPDLVSENLERPFKVKPKTRNSKLTTIANLAKNSSLLIAYLAGSGYPETDIREDFVKLIGDYLEANFIVRSVINYQETLEVEKTLCKLSFKFSVHDVRSGKKVLEINSVASEYNVTDENAELMLKSVIKESIKKFGSFLGTIE